MRVTFSATIAMLAFGTITGSTAIYSQSPANLPDCREANLPLNAHCVYKGSNLPVQVNIGNITFTPPPQTARMTEPLGAGVIAPVVPHRKLGPVTIGGFYTSQTQDGFSHKSYVSDGFKVYADYGLSPRLSIEVRGTVVRYSVAEIGVYSGKNHTFAVTAGPRVQFPHGRYTPYATAQFGAVHQQYYGLNLGAAAGLNLRVARQLSWNVLDLEFRSDQFDPSYRNPVKGRQELSTGLAYQFGRDR